MATSQRTIGLRAVMTVSLGAMIGSGIFVLPGLAAALAGPAVIAAYVIAGLVVIPAVLSKSEMATAMPSSGGAYVFIDRAMGPMLGTIAGLGVWMSLVFTSSFALVGLGGYLVFFLDVPVRVAGAVLAAVLVSINLMGNRPSGRSQTVVVAAVLGVLVYVVAAGAFDVDSSMFEPFLTDGSSGLLAAAALVFVSYTGVTKVASFSEQVTNPGRVLPLGMLGSIGLMLVLYPAVVWVVIGTVPLDTLVTDPAPIATTAEAIMGRFGAGVVSAIAVLALVAIAYTGLQSSSRYPVAMAENRLAPAGLANLRGRAGVPTASVLGSGVMMALLIATVPLIDLAKLASAFQVLVFSLNNLSLIAFRESKPGWYRPAFRSPLYPWAQIVGIVGPLVLLVNLGTASVLATIGVVVGGVVWYRYFGRSRASHESAALDALRLRSTGTLVTTTSGAIAAPGRDHIVIPVTQATSTHRLRDLLRLAQAMVAEDGRITLARTDRERSGALWWRKDTLPRPDDPFRTGAKAIADDLGLDIAIVRPRGPDSRNALVDYATRHAVDLILGELPPIGQRHRGSSDLIWIQDHATSDVMYLGNRDLHQVDSITVLGAASPYDVAKIDAATRFAHSEDAGIQLLHVLDDRATEAQSVGIADYHEQLVELSPVPMTSAIDHDTDLLEAIRQRARESDLVIMGASRSGLGTELSERISETIDAPVLIVHAPDPADAGLGVRVLNRLIY